MKLSKIVNEFSKTLQTANAKKTTPYDTTAEVKRVDGDTAWVHIAGGVDETPVKLTMAAEAGDTVQVRVSGGSAWLTGNESAPPTDDKTAKVARSEAKKAQVSAVNATAVAETAGSIAQSADSKATEAQDTAQSAQDTATEAGEKAQSAQTAAQNADSKAQEALDKIKDINPETSQYFWHESTGTHAGAHVTTTSKEDFKKAPSGGNVLIKSDGVHVRDGVTDNATFTGTGAVIGRTDKTHVEVTPNGIALHAVFSEDDETDMFSVQNQDNTVAVLIGEYNTSGGDGAVCIGSNNYADLGGVAVGSENEASFGCYMFGRLLQPSNRSGTFICGKANDPMTMHDNTIFCIGNGREANSIERENAFEVLDTGSIFCAGHSSAQGSIYRWSWDVSCASASSYANVGSTFTIPVGCWMIQGWVERPAGSSAGVTGIRIKIGGSQVPGGEASGAGSTSYNTRQTFCIPYEAPTNQTAQLQAYHTGGKTLTLTCKVNMMRIW